MTHTKTDESELIQGIMKEVKKLVCKGPQPFHSLRDTQVILGMSRTYVFELIRDKRLDSRRVGKKVYVTDDSIMKLVMGNEFSRPLYENRMNIAA